MLIHVTINDAYLCRTCNLGATELLDELVGKLREQLLPCLGLGAQWLISRLHRLIKRPAASVPVLHSTPRQESALVGMQRALHLLLRERRNPWIG